MSSSTLNAPMSGTVWSIKVHEKEHVHAGHALLTILGDKATHMIAADAEAAVDRLLVTVGDTVVLGQPLVELEEDDEQPQAERNRLLDDAPDWELI